MPAICQLHDPARQCMMVTVHYTDSFAAACDAFGFGRTSKEQVYDGLGMAVQTAHAVKYRAAGARLGWHHTMQPRQAQLTRCDKVETQRTGRRLAHFVAAVRHLRSGQERTNLFTDLKAGLITEQSRAFAHLSASSYHRKATAYACSSCQLEEWHQTDSRMSHAAADTYVHKTNAQHRRLLFSTKSVSKWRAPARAWHNVRTRCWIMAGKEKMWPHGVICGATGGPSEMGHTTSSSGDCTSTCSAKPPVCAAHVSDLPANLVTRHCREHLKHPPSTVADEGRGFYARVNVWPSLS